MTRGDTKATVGACVGAFAVLGSLMLGSYQQASAATPVSAAALPSTIGAHDSPSPTNPGGMPGMDMPGMDNGFGKTATAAHDRPLARVLGAFGGGTSAVLLTAGILRRRDRATRAAREATRETGMSQK